VKYTFSNVRQLGEELVELLLTFVQLSSASVVNSEEGHDTVDDQQTILVAHEILGNFVEKLHLMFGVDSTSVGDVVLS
jgi:hypothetical protein